MIQDPIGTAADRDSWGLLAFAAAAILLAGAWARAPGAESPAGPKAPAGIQPRAVAGEEIWAAHDQILIFDAKSREKAGEIAIDEVVNGIAFSKDGTRAFIGTSGSKDPNKSLGGLYMADTRTRRILSKVTSDPVKDLHVHPGGKRLHVLDWKVRQEERPGGKKRPVKEQFQLHTLEITEAEPRRLFTVAAGMDLYDFAVSPDERTAWLLDPGHSLLRIMDLPAGTFADPIDLSGGRRADGTNFEAAPAKLVVDTARRHAGVLLNGPARVGVLLLDLDQRIRKLVLIQNGSNLRAGRFTPDGKRFLAVSLERLLVLDLEAGRLLKSVPLKESFTSIAVSGTGKEIYLGAPVVLKTRDFLGGGMVEVRDGESFAPLTQMATSITVKFIALAPPAQSPER